MFKYSLLRQYEHLGDRHWRSNERCQRRYHCRTTSGAWGAVMEAAGQPLHIPDWLSDALCRAITGEGMITLLSGIEVFGRGNVARARATSRA